MLEVENLTSGYGMVQILWDVSFKIKEKEIACIIGPNGAGKTTLVRTIIGLLPTKSGITRFIHVSSTAVYGIPDHHPLLEDDALDGVGPYGQAKVTAEEVCREFRARGLVVAILRLLVPI